LGYKKFQKAIASIEKCNISKQAITDAEQGQLVIV
jgi:hypothetical protein